MNSTSIGDWFARHPRWVDAAIGVAMLPMTVGGTLGATQATIHWLAVLVWALLMAVPLFIRRTAPDLAIALVALGCVVQLFALDEFSPADVVVVFALYAVGAYGRPSLRRWWLGAALVGSVLAGYDWAVNGIDGGPSDPVGMALGASFCAAVSVASYVLGSLARQRRENLVALRERAESLERERESHALLAAQEERARIAREMHDIVAHSLSVIVVQSDGARYLAEQQGGSPATVQALGTIGETARAALAETRRLVGVLREEGAAAEYAPSRTLDQIGELVAQASSAGAPVRYEVRGEQHGTLGAAEQMALYRVAQEALTNVLKHAGPDADAEVVLEHRPTDVVLSVRDSGRGATTTDGAGHGLVGMQERMSSVGGTLTARPRFDGGFEVVATLPVTQEIP